MTETADDAVRRRSAFADYRKRLLQHKELDSRLRTDEVTMCAWITCRLQANAGALTNFEVLDFLRKRGATSDPMGCLGAATPSECKVFDYLVKTAACNQTREAIDSFLKRSEEFKLAKAEKLNIINLRPSELPLIYPIIEYCDRRFTRNDDRDEIQNLVDLVLEVLPDPPSNPKEETIYQQEEMQTEEPCKED